ncbi:Asp-tRNA(Asn)/Glu-tRNA(Gln) amidotransferase subunit GatA [Salibacteraceae bacterium]|nr:Asp-tRNA(Asn)/Glu-tRNA(Gln) amidotransferase subunit GatA [Salibacteraceae bacterium]MDB4104450.1 Asp-tRNA(Asn)/Glu-tRNA(Gln) amidotransferase subunit GatA [Salibacteraceae bacterium]MDB9708707.1 Asp-tRNA(Asn)/Glu-tRNA(Gln) amidotransferase subunit GatA [Salibacteraceae bacterium]MDC1220361.1 Asp-tRNA(Asn)/Glu-tRNA(Gln) amidotransferase subunit GatA [bacterium]MDC1304995.1 Asp-tRNA(Asn)/Glu-tRNA(Gln) amidotransferase subunit GatA [Salibacteraceae bacterium]
MALSDYSFVDLATVREDLLSQKISAIDLVEFYLNKAKTEDRFNAFLELFNSSALESAAALDKKINSGESIGELAGAIIGLKDNLCFKDHKVGASSKILDGFTSLYTATAVQNLINQDAIILGRLNCDEFAMGSSNENSACGVVKNPIDTSLVPGGSSGGSAASVAAGLCMASLGSDTGGSIRQPASFTGLVGLKPTYGRISRYGLIAFASSFDQIGPFTKSVDDSELLYKIMAGKDVMDSTSSIKPIHKERSGQSKFTFAYYEEVINSPGLHPKTKTLFLEKIDALKAAGHKVISTSFPYLEQLVPCYYVLTTAEASSNLGRYDGVHYGARSEASEDVPSTYFNSRTEGFGPEVKRRIMLGTFVLSTGYYDAYYSKGQKVRRLIKDATDDILSKADFLISPTTPHPAFKIGEKANDPIALYLEDIFTVQANLAGNPAISVPMGMTDEGLPLGFQFLGKSFDEETLFAAASLI